MSALSDAIKVAMRNWANKGRLHVVAVIQNNYLSGQVLGRRTGRLVRSIASEASADEDSFTVGTNVNYGVGWELGFTRPAYTVRPVFAKALKIPVGGGFIFRKSAHIPAKTFGARPFIQPGLEASYPYLVDTGEKEFSSALEQNFPDKTIVVRRG